MNANYLPVLAALPLGDDTPIWLYCLIGGVSLALIVIFFILSGKKKKDE